MIPKMMVTPSTSEPLLNPTNAKTTHKILSITLTIAALFSLAYLGLVIPQSFYQSNQHTNLHSLCEKSHDRTSCSAFVNEAIPNGDDMSSSIDDIGRKLVHRLLSIHASDITKVVRTTSRTNVQVGAQAVADCLDLMDMSHDRVADSINVTLTNFGNDHDVKTWLSAVLTNHVTCLDGLENYSSLLLEMKSMVKDLISRSRALLAIHAKVSATFDDGGFLESSRSSPRSYPAWLRRSDRKLLEVSGGQVKADLVVAKDGSGNFRTVAEAVAAAPDKCKDRYVIYVKKGVYKENVEVGKNKKNLMIVGDGMRNTIITGNLNVVDGSTTFRSATLAVGGDGFILQDIGIHNTAGPEKHQAVALRVSADRSVINRCDISAYQDTLYTHTLRQFYTKSCISGTVDFIFGDAAVVFQNCDLIARKPMPGQMNMVTAQGRTDPNQNTGTSIQYCNIIPSSDLSPDKAKFPTFLGRPWKEYSRTVIMQSVISDHVHYEGWFKWDGDFALNTLYYAEYKNSGPGGNTGKRIKWKGYHALTDPQQAKPFTVAEFIQGRDWLNSAGVTYIEGL